MFGLPKTTEIKKVIYKNVFHAKFDMRADAKERFDNTIQRMTLTNEISSASLAIAKGETVSSIFVFHVLLKTDSPDEKTVALLTKLIDQNILLALEFEEKIKFAVFHTRLMATEWMSKEEASVKLNGIDLDAIWENIIVQVGGIQIEEGNSLDEQIRLYEEVDKIKTEIAKLEKLARKEQQPSKKFALACEIKKKQMELKRYSNK